MNLTTSLLGWAGVLACATAWADPTNTPAIPPLPSEDRPLAERFATPAGSSRILRILHGQQDDPALARKPGQRV